jgi:hypothetical protein
MPAETSTGREGLNMASELLRCRNYPKCKSTNLTATYKCTQCGSTTDVNGPKGPDQDGLPYPIPCPGVAMESCTNKSVPAYSLKCHKCGRTDWYEGEGIPIEVIA